MTAVDVVPASGPLRELLDRVAPGETITLTEGGRPVARLGPATPAPRSREDRERLGKEMLEYRDRCGPTLGDLTIREAIEEGRRF